MKKSLLSLGAALVVLAGCGGKPHGAAAQARSTRPAATTLRTSTPAPVPSATTTTPPVAPAPTPPPPTRTKLQVTAWLPYWGGATGTATVKAQVGAALDEVDVFSYAVKTDGSLSVLAGAHDAALLAAVHNNGGTAFMTVTGVNGTSALADATRRARFVDACVAECAAYHYDGVDLDWESLLSADRAAFTGLCDALATSLHAHGRLLSVTAIAKTADHSSWGAADALDFKALGKIADRFKVMTYDYSGSWGAAGPIGPTFWAEKVLLYAIAAGVPKDRLYLGVPFYGRDWKAPKNCVAVSASTAASLAARAIGGVTFDKASGEAHFQYVDSASVTHTVWFQNAQAMQARCDLAKKLGIAGVSCWSVNQETKDIWAALDAAK